MANVLNEIFEQTENLIRGDFYTEKFMQMECVSVVYGYLAIYRGYSK